MLFIRSFAIEKCITKKDRRNMAFLIVPLKKVDLQLLQEGSQVLKWSRISTFGAEGRFVQSRPEAIDGQSEEEEACV